MMKKLLFLSIVVALISCNSSGTNSSSKDSATEIKSVQNVNGNMPDSTNSGPITGSKRDSLTIDSSRVDSTKH